MIPFCIRPPSPLIDPVREKYINQDKLVEDFEMGFLGPDLADVVFVVGESVSQSVRGLWVQ